MKPHLRLDTSPVADPANVVAGEQYRITVLDAGLVRLEHSPSGRFEDRASQRVINRAFPQADFELLETEDGLEIRTSRLTVAYDRGPFSAGGLSVTALLAGHSEHSVWRYGSVPETLGGTARTLDEADGAIPLEPGVVTYDTVALVDDSHSVLLEEDGWIAEREPGSIDLYVFAYPRDPQAALDALYALTGPPPLLPRHALGNWWSRYHAYSADEYLALMDRFDAAEVPLAVSVIDMDWHLVDIDPRFGSGWTGYTFNRELFPDPAGFLAALHERGLATSLNVHPAEGVHAHEDAYPAIARRMGIDPATERPVAFDPTDPAFLEAYLEELHHPLEAEGVDLWWLDWQQGAVTKVAGLDPLWLLNHFHFLDAGRDGRRPLTFSRYAGIGSHRYPVGFSGDTVITWASLDFQPRFTATASNAGYGWWSHDVGGHFFGAKDDELATRWVQLGVFSPITRLHAGSNPFNTREPWRFSAAAQAVMESFLRLRHQLLPYLATMNVRAHEGTPLVRPMHHEHPDAPEAYACPNQFLFGSELLVAPITTPADPVTRLGSVRAWLPPGEWQDVFTAERYTGGRWIHLHRDLESIPVLAGAGAVLPLAADPVRHGTGLPSRVEVRAYPGADGAFTLVEDRDDERWARTRLTFADGALHVAAVEGDAATVPADRAYDLVVVEPDLDTDARLFRVLDRAQAPYRLKEIAWDALEAATGPAAAIAALDALELPAGLRSALGEHLLARL